MRAVVYLGTGIVVYWVLKRLFGKPEGSAKDVPNKYFMWVAVAASIVFWVYGSWFGPKCPGAFFEKGKYSAKVYVLLYPDNQKVKSYRVPAIIRSDYEDSGYEEESSSYRVYRIDYAFMPNGGCIDFTESDSSLTLNQTETAFDKQHRYWGIRLTGELVKE